jgi:predicted lipoprotein with Yx(FWY)xxD motif
MRLQRSAAFTGAAVAALATCMTLTSCGAYDGNASHTITGIGGKSPEPAGDIGVAEAPSSAQSIRIAANSRLGAILADGGGRTLYRYDRDGAQPARTTCVGDCARLWPPEPWTPGMKLTGVNRAVIGRVARPDGTWQLTVGGWPMYRYVGDEGPGDAHGHGVGGAWFASTPIGTRARLLNGAGIDPGAALRPSSGPD